MWWVGRCCRWLFVVVWVCSGCGLMVLGGSGFGDGVLGGSVSGWFSGCGVVGVVGAGVLWVACGAGVLAGGVICGGAGPL